MWNIRDKSRPHDLRENGEAADSDEVFPDGPKGGREQVEVVGEVEEEACGDDQRSDEEDGEGHGASDGELEDNDIDGDHAQRLNHDRLLLPLLYEVRKQGKVAQ